MWKKSEHTVNQPRARHSHYASANRLRQQGSLISPFPVSPSGGKPGRAGSPHAAGTLCATKKRWHTSMPRLPPQGGFQSAPLTPPCASPRWVPPGPRRDGRPRSAGSERNFKDGRHAGLDFYDLLIEAKSWIVVLDQSALTVNVTWTPDNHPGSLVEVKLLVQLGSDRRPERTPSPDT